MAVPRAVVIGIVGAALILVAFVVTRGQANGEDGALPTQPVEQPASSAEEVPKRAEQPTEQPAVPPEVARALGRARVVVLLLSQRGAADDRATRRALHRLSANRNRSGGHSQKVAFFTDRIANIGDYRGLIGGLGISQAPSIVIVDRKMDARLVEGFTDYRSLRQHVADALR